MRLFKVTLAFVYFLSSIASAYEGTVASLRIPGGGAIGGYSSGFGGSSPGEPGAFGLSPGAGLPGIPLSAGSNPPSQNGMPPKGIASAAPYNVHAANRGFTMAADLAGFARLDRVLSAEKWAKEYEAWKSRALPPLQKFYLSQPKTQAELGTQEKLVVLTILANDAEESRMLAQSGEALVIMDYTDSSGVHKILRAHGIDTYQMESGTQAIFYDLLTNVVSYERNYLSNLIDFGHRSTGKMRDRTEVSIEALHNTSSEAAQVLSEFGGKQIVAKGLSVADQQKLDGVKDKVARIDIFSEQGRSMSSLAGLAIREAELAAQEQDQLSFNEFLKLAETVADLGLGLDPVTGFYRSLAEAVSGRNLVTGEVLSDLERSIAVAVVLSLGTGGVAGKGAKIIGKMSKGGVISEKVAETARSIGNLVKGPVLPGAAERLSKFSKTERATAEFYESIGKRVEKNTLEGVHGSGRQFDAFIDGVPHEFKTVKLGATNTTFKNAIRDSLENGGQSRKIVIDARGKGVTESEAHRGISRAFGVHADKLDYVEVIGDDYYFRRIPER